MTAPVSLFVPPRQEGEGESRWQENKMRSRMSTASRLIVGISKTFVTI